MSAPSHVAQPAALKKIRNRSPHLRDVRDIIGSLLVVAAGLALGAIIGLFAGGWLGLIQFAC